MPRKFPVGSPYVPVHGAIKMLPVVGTVTPGGGEYARPPGHASRLVTKLSTTAPEPALVEPEFALTLMQSVVHPVKYNITPYGAVVSTAALGRTSDSDWRSKPATI